MTEIINYHIFKARNSTPNEQLDSPFVIFPTGSHNKDGEILRAFYSTHATSLGSSLVRKIQNDYGEFPRDIIYSLAIPASGSIHNQHGRLGNYIYEELSPDERTSFLESLGEALKNLR